MWVCVSVGGGSRHSQAVLATPNHLILPCTPARSPTHLRELGLPVGAEVLIAEAARHLEVSVSVSVSKRGGEGKGRHAALQSIHAVLRTSASNQELPPIGLPICAPQAGPTW